MIKWVCEWSTEIAENKIVFAPVLKESPDYDDQYLLIWELNEGTLIVEWIGSEYYQNNFEEATPTNEDYQRIMKHALTVDDFFKESE